MFVGCSHAMIILRGVCIEQTVFAPSFVEQSVHCVMCGAATVIMPIMSSRDNLAACFMVGTKNPDKEGGREGELTCLTAAGCGRLVRR